MQKYLKALGWSLIFLTVVLLILLNLGTREYMAPLIDSNLPDPKVTVPETASAPFDAAPNKFLQSKWSQMFGRTEGQQFEQTGTLLSAPGGITIEQTTIENINEIGGSPGGANTQIQFNDGGALGADSSFTWDKTTQTLQIAAQDETSYLKGADVSGAGHGGSLIIDAGDADTAGNGGSISILGGSGVAGHGGSATIQAGSGNGSGKLGGGITLSTGGTSSSAYQLPLVFSYGGGVSVLGRRGGTVNTTDASATNITDTGLTISTSKTAHIEGRIVARRTGGTAGTAGDGASYKIVGTYKNISGTVSLIGSVSVLHSAEDQAAWDATFVISGTSVFIQVTGEVDNNITWEAELIYMTT